MDGCDGDASSPGAATTTATGERVGEVDVVSGGHDVLRRRDDAQLVEPGALVPPHRMAAAVSAPAWRGCRGGSAWLNASITAAGMRPRSDTV